jgi:hypothetical protein
MKLASILVAAAGVGLAGYAISNHLGGDSGPVAEVVTLPPKRPVPGEPVATSAVRAPVSEAIVRTPAGEPSSKQIPDSAPKAAAVPGDRASLARALQRELQRVGCYEGEVNGSWTTSTRMAMKAFTDRVNASLPIDAPDYILLSLVQRHDGRACGTNCPSGQLLSDEGRCVPSAVLAKAATPKPAAESREAKDVDKPAVSSSSTWSPTAGAGLAGAGAGLAADARSPGMRGSAALAAPKPDTAPVESREDRQRFAAAKRDAGPDPEARPDQRLSRADEADDEQPRRKVRKAKYRQPKIVRKFLRSMRRSFAGMPF